MGVYARRSGLGVWVILALLALCLLAYGRSLALPLISDDYLQISLARQWGPITGWLDLLRDPLYRCRATSLVLTYWTERLFGLQPWIFNASSLAIHYLNCLLVFALGFWRPIGWRISAVAAGVFAVHQGHQEAVIWYAALPELLVFTFVLLSLLCWLAWLERRDGRFYAAAACCFVLALLSKESGVMLVPLLALTAWVERRDWKTVAWSLPMALAAAVYFVTAYLARDSHLHFNDGTFSLTAPVWQVLPRSMARLLWVAGFLSIAVLFWARARRWLPLAAGAMLWSVITFLPYSFLTYMPAVPSRHTYLASLGMACLVATALLVLFERAPRRSYAIAAAVALVMVQVAYLWTKKHHQYTQRAAPTQRLLEFARDYPRDSLHLGCFAYGPQVAEAAVEVWLGKKMRVTREAGGGPREREFCFEVANPVEVHSPSGSP
jgi:hypothetical protein